jgi:hypothetical protein
MYNKLISFVNKHNILPKAQIGFRKMKSTIATSQTSIQTVQEANDKCLYMQWEYFLISHKHMMF